MGRHLERNEVKSKDPDRNTQFKRIYIGILRLRPDGHRDFAQDDVFVALTFFAQ